jgi:hypothetical protein
VGEAIDISRGEDEAAAELEGILAKFVLLVACGAGSLAALEIVAAKKVKEIGGSKVSDSVRLAFFIHEQGESDAGFFAEKAGIVAVAQANRGEGSAFVQEGLLVFAQLRDVLAAKDSAVMAKKHDDGGLALPQRTEANFPAVGVGENDVCELLAETFFHVDPSLKSRHLSVKDSHWSHFSLMRGSGFVFDSASSNAGGGR